MHYELRTLLYDAEVSYLQTSDLEHFQVYIASMQARLEAYECLRDQEITIFQPIADQLLVAFPLENRQILERALKHWLSVLRHSAMAMLLNNAEFLQYRLLEWLSPVVKVHQMEALENALCQLLLERLHQVLSEEQFALVHPFIEQARTTLLTSTAPSLSASV